MGWPQWTWVVLACLTWLHALAMHGKETNKKHDVGITTAGIGLAIFLLWNGGFFG